MTDSTQAFQLSAEPDEPQTKGDAFASSPRRGPFGRSRLYLAMGCALGLVLSVMVLVLQVSRGNDDELQVLHEGLTDIRAAMQLLEQRVADLEATDSRVGKLSADLDASLAKIYESLAAAEDRFEHVSDQIFRVESQGSIRIEALDERLKKAMGEVKQARELALARRRSNTPASNTRKPSGPPEPPFQITGVEHRGGKAFLSISSGSDAVRSLSDVRMLGEHDAIADWTLEEIQDSSAVFNVNGHSVTMPLPYR